MKVRVLAIQGDRTRTIGSHSLNWQLEALSTLYQEDDSLWMEFALKAIGVSVLHKEYFCEAWP